VTEPRPLGPRIGDILVGQLGLAPEDLELALDVQRSTKERLGKILLDKGLVQPVDLVRALALQANVPFVDLDGFPIDWGLAQLVPEPMARRHRALVVAMEEGRLVVAMVNPADVFALDDIRTITRRELSPRLAEPMQIEGALQRLGRGEAEMQAAIDRATVDSEADEPEKEGPAAVSNEDAPIVRFVDLMLTKAAEDRASDVHVEPSGDGLRIRYRIDGVLHDAMRAPVSLRAGIISRLKIMADLDIAERRVPQDGRTGLRLRGRTVDLRVATIPTIHGESAVLRILDPGHGVVDLSDSGFLPDALARFQASYRRPWGAILVTGPTGSGKTTTLHAVLQDLNDPSRNLLTIEDPVEYRLDGVKQVQVNPKAGLTFATALRSFLRADPDILLVGEIRDRETAVIAAEASLTGHLVLSSLHTNDAASTPLRLLEIGVEPFMVTSAVQAVLAQRLARRLCGRCRAPHEPDEAELAAAGWPPAWLEAEGRPTLFRAVGCAACARTGYRGRFAIHEVLVMSEALAHLILARAPAEEVRSQAVADGMVPLREDGLRKVAAGATTLEELGRVIA
jgi:type IV pilus assembly protein PilB